MADSIPRLPCPACLGATMEKAPVGGALVLDHCRRCGGVWFDDGEVARLRAHPVGDLWKRVTAAPLSSRVPCHSCHAPMRRNLDACPACGWRNRIDCPACDVTMEREVRRAGLVADSCRGCGGVWLDHAELSMVWSAAFAAVLPVLAEQRTSSGGWGLDVPVDLMGDVIGGGAELLGHVASASVEVIAALPQLALGAAEVAAHVAGLIFQVVLEILCGLLDGL
ncbi:MAG TPA: zf-TFIIB domain-containing protein [Longimicrobium sp.]|nr:zf-TFIIB domain-containing protein [Longimicrobium sp.]